MGAEGKGKGKGGKGKGKAEGKAQGKGKGAAKGGGKGEKKWTQLKPYVLVTGASGYVAMQVIQRLLGANYRVKGTVRSLSNEETVGPLKKAFPTLELVEADLLGGSASFETAMQGCKYVIHTASPFKIKVADAQKDLVDPALKGTEAVMEAALKAGISRVVLTTSLAAMCFPPEVPDGQEVSDADWNTVATLQKGPYQYSKTVAEKRAWEMAKDKEGFSLATVGPAFVLGPMLGSRSDGESIEFMKGLLEGTSGPITKRPFPASVVDVRDVAAAHVAAMEKEDAGGKRFLVCHEKPYSGLQLAEMIREKFKAYPIPAEGEESSGGPVYNISQAKEILKFKPRPIELTMKDMASAAIKLGIVKERILLKQTKFDSVSKVQPDTKGISLLVKVVSKTEGEALKSGGKVTEVVVGDSTGIVTLQLLDNEIAAATDGAIVEVRNASVRMLKGRIRLQVGKWGKVSKHDGDKEVEPNKENDMSAMEYELVQG